MNSRSRFRFGLRGGSFLPLARSRAMQDAEVDSGVTAHSAVMPLLTAKNIRRQSHFGTICRSAGVNIERTNQDGSHLMINAPRIIAITLATSSLAAASALQAHAVWFAERAVGSSATGGTHTGLAVIFGDGSEESDPLKRQKLITGVAGYDSDFRPIAATLEAAGPLLLFKSGKPATVETLAVDYGTWSKRPDGEWVNAGRDEVTNAKASEHNYKYAVHLSGPVAKRLPLFADQVIQIVPLGPIPQKMGKPLKVRVFYKGKPLAGALIQPDEPTDPDDVGQKTAKDGTTTIRVRNQGLNVVVATFDAPSDQPKKYDQMEYKATLSFVLPHAPE
jgi:nickel transport protein